MSATIRDVFVTNEATCCYCGHVVSECECEPVANEAEDDPDWEEVEDDEDDDEDDPDQDLQERVDNLYPDLFEESAMIRNVDKSRLTYMGLPGEMVAGDPIILNKETTPAICLNCSSKGTHSCNSCSKTKQPEQPIKRSPSGVALTPMPLPGER